MAAVSAAGRGQTGVDESDEFGVQTQPVCRPRMGYVGAGKNGHTGSVQLSGGPLGVLSAGPIGRLPRQLLAPVAEQRVAHVRIQVRP